MGAFTFLTFSLTLFCVLSFQTSIVKATYATSYHATKCSHDGPSIRYPFHIKGQNPHYDTLPGFELLCSCKGNLTTIHFPSYGDLVVKSISYDTKKIDLLDPQNCVHGVFLNLNLSLTPFHYYHVLKNYTYLHCSTSLSNPFIEVPCLSGSGSHVYTVDPSPHVPGSCEGFRTVAIPFQYSPYLSDNSLGLALTWELPESQDRKAGSHTIYSHTVLSYTVLGFGICFLLVAIIALVNIKAKGSTMTSSEEQGRLLQSSPYV